MTTRGHQNLDSLTPQLGKVCSPCFRRVTNNCKKHFQVSLAAIALREDRHLRLYYDNAYQRRMLLDDALCGLPLVIPGEQVVIPDLHEVPEEMQPHFAVALGMRSYAGVPIFLDEHLVGSLSLADSQPRNFVDDEISYLKKLADWTGDLLKLHL
ncbi:GAF domain-containing protein [Marinospirillum perlucidum]|uniref:GAF domain-containing protein n=1 Tax=Marinospirillum perlucidum TaxID=1982602 RepID=UPI000DF3197D|nr:GAF domain-containing protein [Marinospirillum perlucidum]